MPIDFKLIGNSPSADDDIPVTADRRYLSIESAIGTLSNVGNQRIGIGALLAPAADPILQHGVLDIAIGVNALASVTNGSWNVAIGPDAGWQVSTGFENVFVGIQAGIYATTGRDNTGVGTNALEGGPEGGPGGLPLGLVYNTGSYNSAFGVSSGFFVKAGSENVFVGNNAGNGPGQIHPTVNGDYNTFVGRYTGPNTGDPNYTTALGANATTNGDGSVAIGTDHLGNGAAATGQDDFALGTASHLPRVPSGVLIGSDTALVLATTGVGSTPLVAIRPKGRSTDAGALHVLDTGGLRLHDGGGAARSTIYSGTGSPNGILAAVAGDLYIRTDGGAGTWLYRNTGASTWTAVA